jgi:hypothetical protein
MTSNIMVKDGHTIVIGGLFRESSDTARSQTPFLGNLPVAGALFRNQRDRTTREEIIIMLTPHVLKDDAAYSKMSEEEMKRMEKLRVGVRKGMMPWGRERLAEGEYDKAMAELAKPNPNNQRALWHLDCATNLNPKFLEAIELKQKVSGREITSVDNSAIRGYVRGMVMAERGMAVPPAMKTGDDKSPAKSSNPTASTEPSSKDSVASKSKPMSDEDFAEFAEFDEDGWPLDLAQPEADQVVNADKSKSAAAAPTTQPSTATAKSDSKDQPKSDEKAPEATASKSEPSSKDEPKSDKPSDAKPAPGVTVTELPVEEVNPVAPPADDNK